MTFADRKDARSVVEKLISKRQIYCNVEWYEVHLFCISCKLWFFVSAGVIIVDSI